MNTTPDLTKATQRPWSVQANWHYQTIRGPHGAIINNNESADICGNDTALANAALIVTAVNEYEALCVVAEAAKRMVAETNKLKPVERLRTYEVLTGLIIEALSALESIRNQTPNQTDC